MHNAFGSRLCIGLLAGVFASLAQATPPLPVPPPPFENPAFIAGPEPTLASTGDPKVDAYRERLLADRGDPRWRPYLARLLAGTKANPAIVERFDKLAAIRAPKDYIAHYVTPERIKRGRLHYRQLKRTAKRGEMPLELRIALWGMLSDYGARKPEYDALDALLVLGAYERGAAPWDFQLHHAARLVTSGVVPRARLKAYETGRLGQPQLLPDRFVESARDGNGDGRANVWTSRADILASMSVGDWTQYPAMPVYVAVKPARFDLTDPMDARRARALDQPNNVPSNILRRWDGQAWTREQQIWSGSYLEPFGKTGPAFLMLLPTWPVNSLNPARPRYFNDDQDKGFALAAGLLADAIAGRPLPPLRN